MSFKLRIPSLLPLVSACFIATALHAAEGTLESNGVTIRYVIEGDGEPVVFIHGWMGDSSMWGRDDAGNTRLNAERAKGFQLIALDCRGHGKSGKPHDVESYGREMAEDVVRLLDHLRIRDAHLVGYSSGVFIAANVVAKHPQRVRSVIYAAQAPLIDDGSSSPSSEVKIFARTVDKGEDLGAYIIAVTPADKPKPTAEQASAVAKWFYAGKDVKAFAAAGLSFEKLAVPVEELKKSDAPVLFIHGANESDGVKQRVAAVHALLGRGEVKTIAGGDHVTTLSKPEFAVAVLEFLRAHKRS